MNWFMYAVGGLEVIAGVYGYFITNQGWRFMVVNIFVGFANVIFAGMKG